MDLSFDVVFAFQWRNWSFLVGDCDDDLRKFKLNRADCRPLSSSGESLHGDYPAELSNLHFDAFFLLSNLLRKMIVFFFGFGFCYGELQ